MVKRFEVYLVNLDPTVDGKPQTARPCVILSPDEMNRYLPTVIVAPLTSQPRDYPTRIPINFKFKNGQIALEQMRTVDKARLIKPLGRLGDRTRELVLNGLAEMFTE